MSNSTCHLVCYTSTGVSSLGVPGVPGNPQILVDQLTLSQPGGTDYTHQTILVPPGFTDLSTALK